jgi:hypothetical protein
MKSGNKLGLFGIALLLLGVFVMLFPTADTKVVEVGGYLEIAAFVIIIVAAFRASFRWLFLLLLAPASFYLWLLAQGH